MKGPPLSRPKHETIGACLFAAASTNSGLVFVDARERETFIPWADVERRARRTAASMKRLGVSRGERVALLFPTSPEYMDAFFGAILAGAVPVPLYPPVRLGRLDEYHQSTARMLKLCGASLVLADAKVRLLLGEAVARAGPRLGCHTLAQLPEPGVETLSSSSPGEPALIQFSSGSTTDPKPVALTHAQLMSQLSALDSEILMPADEPRVGVSWLPLYHDMGLIGCLLLAAYLAGTLVLIPPELFLARPGVWLRALSRHRALVSPAPNFAFGLCLKRVKDEELRGVDLSSWRHALNGAEPVSARTLRRFAERFAEWGFRLSAFRPVYGLSEAALAVTFPPAGRDPSILGVDAAVLATEGRMTQGEREVVSVGRPLPGFEVQVRGERDEELPEGMVGRLLARGPSVMEGYFGLPEATAAVLSADGWLDTGDLGFTHRGELFVTGRAKDLVVIRGANHSPQDFEACLHGIESLRTGCAVALGFVPPDEQDEALLVLAEHMQGASSAGLEARIKEAVLAGTGVRPHTVLILAPGTLPRTSSGKLRRREALARFESGTLRAPKETGIASLAADMLRGALALARTGR